MAKWIWDPVKEQYVKIDKNGRKLAVLTAFALLALRDAYTNAILPTSDQLTDQLATGQITLPAWYNAMQALISNAVINQYALGIGGYGAISQSDKAAIAEILNQQFEFLNSFAREIQQGRLSPAQIAARARMYLNSSTQAYEKATANRMGVPRLPAYPGDGSTQCRSNCKCNWEIRAAEGYWECFWRLNIAEHCPDCVSYSSRWNPLVLPMVR